MWDVSLLEPLTALVWGLVVLVGGAVAAVSCFFSHVRDLIALVGGMVAKIGELFALVGLGLPLFDRPFPCGHVLVATSISSAGSDCRAVALVGPSRPCRGEPVAFPYSLLALRTCCSTQFESERTLLSCSFTQFGTSLPGHEHVRFGRLVARLAGIRTHNATVGAVLNVPSKTVHMSGACHLRRGPSGSEGLFRPVLCRCLGRGVVTEMDSAGPFHFAVAAHPSVC